MSNKHFHWITLLSLLCGISSALGNSLLLRNGVIHTVSQGTLNRGDILLIDDKINRIAPTISVEADAVTDLQGQHVYPGLIVASSTLGLVEINAVRATRDYSEVGRFTPEVQSWVAVNPDSEILPVARANGITHMVPTPRGGTIPGSSAVMALSPWTIEDMLVRANVGLNINWPAMSLNTRFAAGNGSQAAKSPGDQRKQWKQNLDEITSFFKEAQMYHENNHSKGLRVPAWEAMKAVIAKKTPLFIHANTVSQIRSAIDWSTERGMQCVIIGGRDAWHIADEIARAKVAIVYEHIYTQPNRDTDRYDVHFRAPSILADAGVKVVINHDSGSFEASNARNLPYDAAQAVAYGLPEDEALRSITLSAAEVLGIQAHTGSLEAGKDATLIVVDGPILETRSNVRHMWIKGEKMPLDSRHTRLNDRYTHRPKRSSK